MSVHSAAPSRSKSPRVTVEVEKPRLGTTSCIEQKEAMLLGVEFKGSKVQIIDVQMLSVEVDDTPPPSVLTNR